MMKLYTLLVLALLFGFKAFSQYEGESIAIFGSPQYLIKSGIRIDVDIKKPDSRSWYSFSPYYFSDTRNIDMLNTGGGDYDAYDYDRMKGFGLGLEKRIYLISKNNVEGMYLKYGIIYKYYNIEGSNYMFRDYVEDDLTYMKLMSGEYEVNIHNCNAITAFGYSYELVPNLILDLYIGFGIKYSFHNSPQDVAVKYNRNYVDFGFTGMHMIGGFRLGVVI